MSYILYGLVIVLFILSYIKDNNKTKKAIKIGFNTFKKLMMTIVPMMFLVGITLSILSPSTISTILGEKSGFRGMALGLIVGSVAHMPSFVAFPLGSNLLEHGGGYPQVAAFISSLMAVGIVTLGLEIEEFGKKFTILRNLLAIFSSIVFTLIIWKVM